MKKIYSKLTKERAEEFQIETAIYLENDGSKVVEKKPLTSKANEHVEKMYKNYIRFKEEGKEVFLACEFIDHQVRFPFVQGESFYEKILKELQKKNKEGFIEKINQYDKIVDSIYSQQVPFETSAEFEQIFGKQELNGMPSAKYLDIDLIFDNLIQEKDRYVVLDYEWMWECLVPVKFAKYRALYALWVKHGHLITELMEKEEYFMLCDVSPEDCARFKNMNAHFMTCVEGTQYPYAKILEQYRKKEVKLFEKEEKGTNLQIYWSLDGAYSTTRMTEYAVEHQKKVQVVIPVDKYENTDAIRIDPIECAGMIKVNKLEVENAQKVRKLSREEIQVNEWDSNEGRWVFVSEDPQIIIPIKKEEKWENIILEYEVVYLEMNSEYKLLEWLHNVKKKEIQTYSMKNQELEQLSMGQARLLQQSALKMMEYERTIQLLKDKLAYIESTSGYKALIKRKVDNIHLWDDIK